MTRSLEILEHDYQIKIDDFDNDLDVKFSFNFPSGVNENIYLSFVNIW